MPENVKKEKSTTEEGNELKYTEPFWGSPSTHNFSLEVIKEGTVVETLDLTKKSCYLFGVCLVPLNFSSTFLT